MLEFKMNDIQELQVPKPDNFQSIRPEHGMTVQDAREFWNQEFKTAELSHLKAEYINELKKYSEYPETISDHDLDKYEIKKQDPETVAALKEEFQKVKPELKKAWEELNGKPWPKYEKDVYSANGNLIRKAGSDYDAHHKQPLSLGGKNEVGNITPLSAECHYDHQGVHASGSTLDRIQKAI